MCIVFGYAANWKYQRERFRAKARTALSADDNLLRHCDGVGYLHFPQSAPLVLSFIGERGQYAIQIAVPEQDCRKWKLISGSVINEISSAHRDYVRAKSLFPESRVVPYVVARPQDDWYLREVNVVDAVTGKLIEGAR